MCGCQTARWRTNRVLVEAASLAGHLGLGKLIYLYDQNQITLAGTIGASLWADRRDDAASV